MDPLNVYKPEVPVRSLPVWQDSLTTPSTAASTSSRKASKFVFDEQINRKVVLWEGDITSLSVDAIVNSTNEALRDKNPLSEYIFARAGPELRAECDRLEGCRTGEAKLSKGCDLPAKHIIHTVGPRYNVKYRTAAESALYNCYRNILQLMAESKLHTVALCVINSVRRGFPPEVGAHIALRTVRRYLEKFGDAIHLVVFAVEPGDREYYDPLMPLYFPRSIEEEQAAISQLPADTGNEFGEPVIEERKIRIVDTPLVLGSAHDTAELPEVLQEVASAKAFTSMSGDHDAVRREQLKLRPQAEAEELENARRYQRWLQHAKSQDLTDLAKYRMIYQSGVDSLGRPVVLFIGKYFPANRVDLERAISYFITVMDSIANREFVFVYFHTETASENHPDFSWLKQIYQIVDHRYKRNARAIYIVHPTFLTKCVTWFFTTFTASNIKEKVINIENVTYLYNFISPDQLDIPSFVLEYDIRVNGAPATIATHRAAVASSSSHTDDL
ncbi:ganglioside-induced differentiation-associated protein 2 [Capsaspora owczarzaki ATCC 30864]|nr:ganglioside-induced differentiation-associated protein 2 [Capsaspora owczarzaki ATCC 30864]|eukprot:XP_004365513.1 ganglioside-induced differentiation-associated protein 2 [Capsaspora owczarzaki ATCC 30864]